MSSGTSSSLSNGSIAVVLPLGQQLRLQFLESGSGSLDLLSQLRRLFPPALQILVQFGLVAVIISKRPVDVRQRQRIQLLHDLFRAPTSSMVGKENVQGDPGF